MKINYITEPVEDYKKGIDEARSSADLIAHISKYRVVANDALIAARQIALNYKWIEFQAGLVKERKREYAGDEWATKYGMIIMPEVMVRVDIFAHEFQVPWGLAYTRMVDTGLIVVKRGIATFTGEEK